MAPAVPPLAPDRLQARVLEHDRGTLLVTGPPGAGKTTLLRERFARLVEAGVSPERVLLLVLNRRAAREARDWLVRRLARSLPDLPVLTAHGFAFRALGRRFRELGYQREPQVLSAPEQYATVREMLRGEPPEEWPTFGGLLGVAGFARQVADLLLRAQERLLAPEDVDRLAGEANREEYREVAAFYGRYLDALAEADQTDFAGLLFQAVNLLERGPAEEERFAHVLVDDYQDATHATEAIVGALTTAAESVVVAADPGGHVFSYRGGTLEPLARLGAAAGPPGTVALEASPRLGARVSALAALGDPADDPPPEAPAGFEARLFAHPGEEVDAVAHELLRWRVDEDVPWEGMAVVVRRYGEYLTALRHALSRHGIPFLVVAEASAVALEPAVRPVIDLLRYVFRPEAREDLLEAVLASPVGGLDPHAVRRLRREARLRGVTLTALVEGGDLDGLAPELLDAVTRLRRLVAEIPEVAEKRGPDGLFFWLWTHLPHFRRLVESEERSRDLDALAALGEILTRFRERRPTATVDDYLDTLEAAEFGPDPWVPPEERHPHAVRVVSAHRAQGTEVEVALVVGCLEGEFPSLGHGYPLVDLEDLLGHRSGADRLRERLAEERALFRLAVSRARRRTVLFASESTGSRNPRTPSRFAARMGLAWAPPPPVEPPAASLRSMEASLRRRLSDREAPPADRLAAAGALAAVGADPAQWWGRRAWSDPGVPLYQGPLRTSYSRLSVLENCALQYLYDIELGLDPDETFQMWLGSEVHSIIDRAQQGEIERSEEAVLAVLDREWRPETFPNRAIEHRRYLDARDMLVRWIRGEKARPELSEQKFAFEVDGGVIRGRIDAVFRMENGHLRVVDFKTSRYAPGREEVKEDLQLAAYFLALKRTPELAGLGEPAFLELAYLGKPQRDGWFTRRQVSPRTIPGYEEWAEARTRELISLVKEERFAPNPEADCRFCEFKTLCPVWRQGGEVPR